jgi:hypothetical protein
MRQIVRVKLCAGEGDFGKAWSNLRKRLRYVKRAAEHAPGSVVKPPRIVDDQAQVRAARAAMWLSERFWQRANRYSIVNPVRTATKDVTIGGAQIRKGERVLLSLEFVPLRSIARVRNRA